ncbi:Splicing factor 3B subunit 6-like protein [Porphyridium purpureum]|uniref:Splicing factor 3B subunit 6-like protein n=1 Tax=Porphyridium purpureum TaxID=35688 RepID=A0A5J4ZBD7_PORPP|nr:Splicing factor 3B subunit 6-like protein [Porphyridium purpureum]|eukprot:POR3229..scf295_1
MHQEAGRDRPPHPSSRRSGGGAAGGVRKAGKRASRILYVRNLPFDVAEDAQQMYAIFGAHGVVRQIRAGMASVAQTRGTAYVVYESARDARRAVEKLSGFNVADRYLVLSLMNYDDEYAQRRGQPRTQPE